MRYGVQKDSRVEKSLGLMPVVLVCQDSGVSRPLVVGEILPMRCPDLSGSLSAGR